MSEQDKSRGSATNVQIVVAIIGLVGVLATALFANWDKIFPKTVATVTTTTTAPTPRPNVTRGTANPSKPIADDFVGRWRNENPDTSGITKVEIDSRLDKIIVHIWGKCHPTDCDWGTQSVPVSEIATGALQVTWKQGFKITKQQIRLLPDRRLEVAGHTHFTDNSHRPDYNRVAHFVKQ